MSMLNSQELDRLQSLSCIQLSQEERESFSSQLSSVVGFLGLLGNLSLDQDSIEDDVPSNQEHSLLINSDVLHYQDIDSLFANTEHEIINRSIVIKSVVQD